MKNEILKAVNVGKVINGTQVLKGLNLSVYEQEILGMTGLSGSGKSVIGEILSGIRSCDEGQFFIEAEKSEPGNVRQVSEKGIYHISKNPCLFSCLTIEENICLIERGLRTDLYFPSKIQKTTIQEALRSLDIHMNIKVSVNQLSLYEKHLVAILRAYYQHAKLIIIDNITNDYTEEEFKRLGNLLLKIRKRGASILFIESMIDRVVSFTDRLVILRNGRDEGILFRNDYNKDNIMKIMVGDYSIPDPIEKNAGNNSNHILLSALDIYSRSFHGLSFSVNHGEIVGFIEEEKIICTDILDLFSGNMDLSGGTIRIGGTELNTRAGREAMIKAGFGYVDYYKNSIFPKLSLKDNLTITSLGRLTTRTAIHSKLEKAVVKDLLARLAIPEENMKKPIKDTSNKEQLIAALYKWILNRSKVVLLNNVLSGTDMIMHNIVVHFLNELRERECGAILLSPNTKELYELCDRVYILREGKVIDMRTTP